MLVSWRYRERDTFLQRLDPRTRLIFMLCMFFGLLPFWDLRFILPFLALAMAQLLMARLSWQDTRRFWLVITVIFTVLSLATLLTGRGGVNVYEETFPYPLWASKLNLFGRTFSLSLSVERFSFLLAQLLRFFTFAALAVPIPFTIHPAQYGIAFRRLGLPDKFAFAIDLASRFVPSLGQDFQLTMDAQRARGYELERARAGLVQQVRNMAPLLIPLIIGSIIRSEEIIDAMDLRAFGTRKRSWLVELRFQQADTILLVFSGLVLAASVVVNLLGYGDFWVPELLKQLSSP